MPRKGMRSLFSSPKKSSLYTSPVSSPSRFGFSSDRPSFSESVMDRTLELVEPMIEKWNPDSSTFARVTSLFYENQREAEEFIKCVRNLHKAMHFLAEEVTTSEKLARAQNLMQLAMKRLQKEFYQILSMNRAYLDPESVSARSSLTSTSSSFSDFGDEDENGGGESIAQVEDASAAVMADLKLIADCMISCGYANECINIYKSIRKSIIDEAVYNLGVEKLSGSQARKMDWKVLDLKIKSLLEAVPIVVKTLFNGERILADHVFASSDSIRESVFTAISNEAAMILFGFPENIARNGKKSPEKIFRCLNMYTALAEHWPEIESIFAFDSSVEIRTQAVNSLSKLGESIRASLKEYESALQKDSSKSLVAGAGIHSLTIETMDYLMIIADYSNVLADILAETPLPEKATLPESYFNISDFEGSSAPAISLHFAWLILVLLCKLDGKAVHYKDSSLAYLFLANNLQYVVAKVRTSNLRYLLGDDWVAKHEAKVKQFASSYERLGWGHVVESLLENPSAAVLSPDQVRNYLKRFNLSLEQAYRKYSTSVVADRNLRDDILTSLAGKIALRYREFFLSHGITLRSDRNFALVVKFTPDDIENYLSDLFIGPAVSGSLSSSYTSSSSRSQTPRSR